MKIFQIGFNRCGTLSFTKFFVDNGIKSVHWLTEGRKNICLLATKNLSNNKKMFDGIDYTFYSDMEFVSSNKIIYLYEYFRTIDEQYPDSKFILNTRDVDDWINSRLNHQGPHQVKPYIERCMDYYKCNTEEVVEIWKEHYHNHIRNILEYFKDTPTKLLHFRLGESDGQDIINFLPNIKFKYSRFSLTHRGKK